MANHLAGGCLCGALRYAVKSAPHWVGHCHCRSCQRSAGAPFLTWAEVTRADFAYTSGTPAVFASSDHGRREFCPTCGTQLVFRSDQRPDMLDVTVASLDAPDALRPTANIFTGTRRAFLHGFDGTLPSWPDEQKRR
ncbi:MAG: GFA family protein [Hyphomicrobiales bacterium]